MTARKSGNQNRANSKAQGMPWLPGAQGEPLPVIVPVGPVSQDPEVIKLRNDLTEVQEILAQFIDDEEDEDQPELAPVVASLIEAVYGDLAGDPIIKHIIQHKDSGDSTYDWRERLRNLSKHEPDEVRAIKGGWTHICQCGELFKLKAPYLTADGVKKGAEQVFDFLCQHYQPAQTEAQRQKANNGQGA